MNSTVQVLVPCYNYGRYLRQCVGSVLSQEGVDVRVLVIDDQSSDDTPEVCRSIAAQDARVEFIRHPRNKGHIATYNEGIARAQGDYFVLLSADDLLTPGSLARATGLMNRNPTVGFTYGYAKPVYGAELPPPRTDETGCSVWRGRDWIGSMCRSGRNFVMSPEVVMRMDIQKRLGGYSASLPHSADMEQWLRAAAMSDVGRVNGADQAYYRVHEQNMHRTVCSGLLFDLKARRDAFLSALETEAAAVAGAAGQL
jgi:glycosyltransferase involved in cell wall biosynthesis